MRTLVILASYNGEKHIEEQINSILNQIDVDVKIYVFDDNSADDTCKIVEKFPEIILKKRNAGSGSAAINFLEALYELNVLGELKKYDYISFCDQDDIWLNKKLSKAISVLKNGFDLYGSNLIMYKNGLPTDVILVKSQNEKRFDFLFEGGSAGCTYVLTPSLAELVCDNYEKIRHKTWKYFSHDWFIYFIARLNGFKTHIDQNSYIFYRIHESNVHGQMNAKSLTGFFKRIKFVFNDWYIESSAGYLQFCSNDSLEYKILKNFISGYFHRILVLLKYNTQLMKSKSKFLKFFILNLMKI